MTPPITENPQTVEIGEFQTPEELAQALEQKSKVNLANRVRQIAGQIQDNSTDLRTKLREELTTEEQSEIRQALPLTGVDEVLDKGKNGSQKAEQQVIEQVAQVIPGGQETVQKLGKMENWWNNIQGAFDEAGKLFNEGKFLAAIGVIFAGLFGKFDLSAWKKQQNGEGDEGEEPRISDKISPTNPTDMYYLGVVALLKMSKGKNQNSYNILNHPQIKSKKYNELELNTLPSNGTGLSDKFGFTGITDKTKNDKEIYQTLSLVKSKEPLFASILKNKHPNWRNEMSLQEIFVVVYQELKFYENFSEVDLLNFDIGKFNIGFLNFAPQGNGDLNEKLQVLQNDETSKLHGISLNFLGKLYANNSTNATNNKNYESLLRGAVSQPPLNEKENIFLNDFLKFGKEFINVLTKNFYLGPQDDNKRKEFEKFFSDGGLTTKNILEFYIITGGNLDSNTYNDAQKGMIYFKVFQLLGENSSLRGATYDTQIIEMINSGFTKGVEAIPESFKDLLQNIIKNTIDTSLSAFKDIFQEIYHALSWKSILAIFISTGFIFYLLSKLNIVRVGVQGVIIGIIATIVATLINKNGAFNEEKQQETAQKIIDELKKENKEKYEELVQKAGSEELLKKQIQDSIENPLREGISERIQQQS